MDDRLARLEGQINALTSRVMALEARSAAGPGAHADDSAAVDRDDAAGSRRPFDAGQVAALLGRTSLVLGGAYLLRALTRAGILPQHIGVVAGLAYALVWVGAARIAVSRGHRMSATFHSQTAVLLTFPLVLEATSSFRVLTPATGIILLALLASGLLASAAWLHLPDLAWSSTLAATVTAIVLAAMTGSATAAGACLVWMAVFASWLGYLREWRPLAWLTAAVADVTVLVIAGRSGQPSSSELAEGVVWLALFLFGAYVLTFSIRLLAFRQSAGAFEMIQGPGSVLVGFGSAIWLAGERGLPAQALAHAGLVLALAAYTVAYRGGLRRPGQTMILEFHASVGAALILLAAPGFFRDGWLTTCWLTAALASMYAARRLDRPGLAIHATVYALAAATHNGLLADATAAIWTAAPLTQTVTRSGLLVLAALVLVASIPPAEVIGRPKRFGRLVKLIVVGVASYLLLGTIVRLTGGVLGATSLATIRTVALAAVTLGLSWLSRSWTFQEASSLVYPLLVSTGLKLVFDDVRHSDPASLFIAFSAFGGALIAAPRLARRSNTFAASVPTLPSAP